ncbi:hypothetical protein [Nocardioides sp. NPDC006303]|uniref:hypothetical protein n=1 Tax=Nocardioides sp. NPDC006303 TaxID=3156747 RepID=UPI0033BEC76C
MPMVPVTSPDVVPFRGRDKWGEIAGNAILAALGVALAWVGFTQVPGQVTPIRVASWFTVFAVGVTIVLVIALVFTRQLPTLRERNVGGAQVLEVHAWRGDWWHAMSLDAALAAAGLLVVSLGFQAGGQWVLPALCVGLVAFWYLGRVLMAALGRRRNEGLVLLDESIVHNTSSGWSQSARSEVRSVRARGNSVLLTLRSPANVNECPVLWRGSTRIPADKMVIKCSMMGHTANDLAQWLQDELQLTGNR